MKRTNKLFTVYKHTAPDGKVYVGITCQNPEYRWNNGRGYKKCAHMWSAIKKYGWESFEHQIVMDGISIEEAGYAEKYLIAWYKIHGRSLNIAAGGEINCGYHLSESHREKISKANSGRKITWRDKISNTLQGRYKGELNPWYGKTPDEDTLAKMKANRKGKGVKKVCIDDIIFDSYTAAANYFGISQSNLSIAISRHRPSVRGHKIRYENECK